MKNPTAAASVLALAALAAPASGLGGVDLEIRNGDKVLGTFDPADATEVFRVRVPSGARFSVSAKAARRGAPARIELRDPLDGLSALGVDRGTKTTVSVPTMPSGGEYRIVATSRDGATTGDYSFVCRWVTPRVVARPLTLPDPGTETLFSFGADAGSRATIDVVAARGSPALPRLLRLRAPDGSETDLGSADAGASSDRATLSLTQTGDYVVYLDHSGGAGDVAARVKLRPPRASRRKIDVSSRRIGGEGFDLAIGRVVGSEGGTVSVPDLGLGGGAGDISGSAVDIPPGALPAGTAIFVGTAPDVDPRGREADLGPSVAFGPDGTRFGTAQNPETVTITIPIDLSLVGGDTTQVVIYTRDAQGRVRAVPPPYDFVTSPGFVSFPSTHFSAYQASRDLPDDVPGAASLFTYTNLGATPTDMAFAFDASDPNRFWYVAVGDRVQEVVLDPASPTVPIVVRDYTGQGGVTGSVQRTNFRFRGAVRSVTSDFANVLAGEDAAVWRIDPATDLVSIFAGNGTPGDAGDDGDAINAQIFGADDVLISSSGDTYIVDRTAARVRRVDVEGVITTVAGTGTSALSADGGAPDQTALDDPRGVAEKSSDPGILYVAERSRIRVIDLKQGLVSTLAGSTSGATGCADATGTAARFTSLSSIAYDLVLDRLFVTDGTCHTIVQVDVAGRDAVRFAGVPGSPGFTQDFSSPPRSFRVSNPTSVFAVSGSIYFLDAGNGRLRYFTVQSGTAK